MKKITLLLLCLLSLEAIAQMGTIDANFNTGGAGPDAAAYTTINQSDGKILIAGVFDNYNGVARSGIARINADGSLDTGFNPGTGLALSTDNIYCMALQSDGKILIGGKFANFNGTPRNNIARLNADGSVDPSFNPGTGANSDVITISIQSTGKIIIGGLFTQFNATAGRLFRLESNGTIDTSFNAGGVGPNSYVWTSSVLPDDRIYIGGGWSNYNGTPANSLLRLNADGTRDVTYTNLRIINNAVLCHAVQPDGKIIIGGYFTSYGQTPVVTNRLVRINSDGTRDNTFNIGTGLDNYPLSLTLQPNGKVLVGGAFLNYNGTLVNRMVRLNTDGSVDTGFVAGTSMSGIVYKSTFQPDGKLLVASEALSYNGNTTQPNLTKISAYAPNAIAIVSLGATSPYCTEQTFDVNYTADGYFAAGNVFTAQLSDASGSFTAPVSIGSINATGSGTISVTIPLITPAGSGYRIRVVGSNLATTGSDNGSNLAISGINTYYEDADNDGFGNPNVSVVGCGAGPIGYVLNSNDCNDNEPLAHTGMAEVLYDGVDNNCDGNLDEGNQLMTSLLPASCGATLASIQSLIGIQTIGGPITGYRIRLTQGAEVQVIEKNVPHFMITQFPSYAYGTAYTAEIMLQRNGVWLGYYGPACNITTPGILAEGGASSIIAAQCGAVLPKINTLIATTSLAGVTGYRFRVSNLTDPSGPNAVQTIDRVQNWFSLQMLTRYNYGTVYQIEVAVKTTGDYLGYGAACNVTSPAVPTLTNCNAVIASGTANIATASVTGATQYRFEITRDSDNASTVITKPTNYFIFNSVPPAFSSPGALYHVRVAVMTSGTWSPYGNSCDITSPGALAKGAPSAETVAMEQTFRTSAYPNPFTADFTIELLTSAKENAQLKVYDMLGRLLETVEMKDADSFSAKIGSGYPSGVYNVIVNQNGTMETLRVVKR
ncbi:T9SS type A sorting domain-containing protein [Flavobacterium sp.]|uniref:T9SS type A sorting domain-containing protein n=1 Tax=Flavobacterium sp. TaxID=239 RepID=UPI0039E2D1F0